MTIDIELVKPYSHVRLDGKKYTIEEVRQALAARATPAQQQWISVKDRLPETYVYDDKPCRGMHGREISPAIQSERVLVALSDGAVCEDLLDGLQGHAPWWSTYRDSVVAWQPMPAAPSIAQDGRDALRETEASNGNG